MPTPVAIGQWLQRARDLGVARLDAQQLVALHVGRTRTWVLAHDDEMLAPPLLDALDAALARRADGVPLAYLVGEREFHGLTLQVDPRVLVPRPETESLVDWALEVGAVAPRPRVADLGTGSGAIALALKRQRPEWQVTGSDRSADALAIAEANARRLALAVHWVAGDWWQPLGGETFDLVVSNPPYVASDDAHLLALRHEPGSALMAGADGLADLRRIIAGAPAHMAPGGWLLLEHGFDQAEAVRALLAQAGFEAAQTRPDLAGLPRCTGGRRAGPASGA
ncbi:MAG: peptide chain release factor N(5)-glutamine methyltransferase [Rubrivivax sp.]|nr:peptide chain release factor N(5)-glutamine methyltransferase [Rubrivivax sp.]